MTAHTPLPLLGGLTTSEFMRRYWQRKPLLVRQAIPNFRSPLSINDIRKLVRRDEVESRLIQQVDNEWHMESGPFGRLPAMTRPNWTVLAQNVDAHDDEMAKLLHQFRFLSDARLDDAMVSIASDGGGVGPHFDSYDVFLLQAHGRRHWRLSEQKDLSLEEGLPLKILKNFQAEKEFVLEPGDMLYLPPHVAHDGVAQGDCMTISIGFRAPTLAVLARGVLDAAGDQLMARAGHGSGLYGAQPLPGPRLDKHYSDRDALPTEQPAQLPETLVDAALKAVEKIQFDHRTAARFLGQWLTEPSPAAWFEPSDDIPELTDAWPKHGVLALDRCTRLMYRGKELYINGELAPLPTTKTLRALADSRQLDCAGPTARGLKPQEIEMLDDWLAQGWIHHLPATKS